MGRFLLLAAAIAGLIWLVRRAAAGRREKPPAPAPTAGALVRCAHCGVHVPRQDAELHEGKAYCGDDHAQRGPGTDLK